MAPFATGSGSRRRFARSRRLPDRVELATDLGRESYDRVVIATHSDQALALLVDPSPAERELLGALPYQANETVLRPPIAPLMPRRRRAWGSWNFHLSGASVGRTTVTYDMNHLQRLHAGRRYLVTLNRSAAIDPAQVIYRTTYDHPVHHARGPSGPGTLGRDQQPQSHPLLRCLLGLGVSRGRRGQRAAGLRERLGALARGREIEIIRLPKELAA